MSFSEIVDKILAVNKLGINTPTGLERHLGVATGAIYKPYKKNEFPGPAVIKKIKVELSINEAWWNTGVGEPFTKSPGVEQKTADRSQEDFSYEMFQEIKKNNEVFKEEIDRLWSLVNRLTSTDVKPSHANKG